VATILSAENYVDYCILSENLHRVRGCSSNGYSSAFLCIKPVCTHCNQNILLLDVKRNWLRTEYNSSLSFSKKKNTATLFTSNFLLTLKMVFWKLEKVISLLGITRGSYIIMFSMYTWRPNTSAKTLSVFQISNM